MFRGLAYYLKCFSDVFSILSFEKNVNEKKKRSDEKCGIISKEFYKGVIDKL